MKTLAQLKRDIVKGTCLILKSWHGRTDAGIRNINIPRFVVKKSTVGICLNPNKNVNKGSYVDFPAASLLEYDGETIKIYNSGNRPLTEGEKQIIINQPRDDKQDEIDIMTDGSTMFYRRKSYFQKSGKYYLFGTEIQAGKRLIQGTRKTIEDGSWSDWAIDDNKCKGEIALVYKIVSQKN